MTNYVQYSREVWDNFEVLPTLLFSIAWAAVSAVAIFIWMSLIWVGITWNYVWPCFLTALPFIAPHFLLYRAWLMRGGKDN